MLNNSSIHTVFRQNRMRFVLGGFGIAWAMLLIVLLLGFGQGFKNGIMDSFNVFAQKTLFLYAGAISGETNGRKIHFEEKLPETLLKRYPAISACSPEYTITLLVSANGNLTNGQIKAVEDDYFTIHPVHISEGRSFYPLEQAYGKRKVIIGESIARLLFGEDSCIGNTIVVKGLSFSVIGLIAAEDIWSGQERYSIILPKSTFSSLIQSTEELDALCISIHEKSDSHSFEDELRQYLAYIYDFPPNDKNALQIINFENQSALFEDLFKAVEIMLWFIGICLLLSGIVGISNLMSVLVKERISEIGIRRALGATSFFIIRMVLLESVIVTFISGLCGIGIGWLLLIAAEHILRPALEWRLLGPLQFRIETILPAFLILSICGIAAGLAPAVKASEISPSAAIRNLSHE